jgi:uncharacterized protein YndB with AHSA1/START domain
MNDTAIMAGTQEIVVDEVFHHKPEVLWQTLASAELMGRWLGMQPTGFEPVKGNRFTYQTTPADAWDGVIHCRVLEVMPNERLAYSWQGGDDSNNGQYGSRLDTVVTFTLTKVGVGTRLRLVHSGFMLPKNDTAFKSMSGGWAKVVQRIDAIAGERNATEEDTSNG